MVIRCANVLSPQFFDELKTGCGAQGVMGAVPCGESLWAQDVAKCLESKCCWLNKQTNKQTSQPQETSMRFRLVSTRTDRQIGLTLFPLCSVS